MGPKQDNIKEQIRSCLEAWGFSLSSNDVQIGQTKVGMSPCTLVCVSACVFVYVCMCLCVYMFVCVCACMRACVGSWYMHLSIKVHTQHLG